MATVWADIEELENPYDAELRLIEACCSGEPCILGDGRRPNPPDPGQAPDPARTIRAPILRYLILGGCDTCCVHERGVELVGAVVVGRLDLSFATARGPTGLIECSFSSSVVAVQARLQALAMSGSVMPGLNAQAVNVVGDVFLREGFISRGEVNLSGSTIGGDLDCNEGKFFNPGGVALAGQRLKVAGDVILSDGFEARGEVSLPSAIINGSLSCQGGEFLNSKGFSLNAHGIKVYSNVLMCNGFKSNGVIGFSYASINGQLFCRGGAFCAKKENILDGIEEKCALSIEGAKISGEVFLDNGFMAVGEVSLSGATIGGQLCCRRGRFCNLNGRALNGQDLRVGNSVFLGAGFSAIGEVTLSEATISGQLSCSGGRFYHPKRRALNGQNLTVASSVFLKAGFVVKGEVFLIGATIGGQLTCAGGKFSNPAGTALDAQRMQVSGSINWQNTNIVHGSVSLLSAHAGDLVDDLESWPKEGRLMLDGFTYDRILGAFTDSERRLEWLKRGTVWNGEFFPQPYAQLAKVLREMGHDQAARDVLVEQTRLIRKHSRERAWRSAQRATGNVWSVRLKRLGVRAVNAGRRIWDIAQRWVVGYGYKPYRSLWFFLGLWVCAAVLGHYAWNSGAMVPASDVVLTSPGWQAVAPLPDPAVAWTAAGAAGEDWETFNSLAWGFDVVVPVLSLGQTEAWAPSAARGTWGWLAWWGRGVLSVLGWVVVGLAAAAVTGLIRRE